MSSTIQTWLVTGFERFAQTFSASLTAGILNYIFVPVQDGTTGVTNLTLTKFDAAAALKAVNDILIRPSQSLAVWSVLPEDSQFGPVRNNIYWLLIALSVLICLIAAGAAITLFVYLCRSRLWTKCCPRNSTSAVLSDSNGRPTQATLSQEPDTTAGTVGTRPVSRCNQGTAYFALGLTCAILLIILFSISVFAFYTLNSCTTVGGSIASSEQSNHGNSSTEVTEPQPLASSFSDVFSTILLELRQFLEEIVPNGELQTNRTVDAVNATLHNNLQLLVTDIMSQLLISYHVQPLIDRANVLLVSVEILENTTTYINEHVTGVLGAMNELQGAMRGYQNALRTAFESFCPKMEQSQIYPTCRTLENEIPVLTFSFNANAIVTEPSTVLAAVTDIFGINLTEAVGKFGQLQEELNKQADVILGKIEAEFDVNSLMQPLRQVWSKLADQIDPIVQNLNSTSGQLEQKTETYERVLFALAYIVLVGSTILLASLTVYLLLYGTECYERSLLVGVQSVLETEADDGSLTFPSTQISPTCIRLSSVIAGVIFTILVIIGCTVVIVTVIAVNDVCRYGTTVDGQNQTDAVLNLYWQSVWPAWIANMELDTSVEELLQLSVPENMLRALLVHCPGDVANVTSEPNGLLPLIGLTNIVNVTAVLQSSDVQTALEQNEQTLVDAVLEVDFSSYIPSNLEDLLGTIENITFYLDSADYNDTIHQLTSPPFDIGTIQKYIQSLKLFAQPYTDQYSEARTILHTAEAIQTRLDSTDSVLGQAAQLGQAFKELQSQRTLTAKLEEIDALLNSVKQTLEDPALVEKPIRPAYRRSTKLFLANLSIDLENDMSQFTNAILPCTRFSAVVTDAVQVFCADHGVINGLGAFCFNLIALALILLLTLICYTCFLKSHQTHCLYAIDQGIPMYLMVKYVYNTKQQ